MRLKSRVFVLIFVVMLVGILAAFVYFVQTASSTLPQDDEIITVEDAAARIQAGEIERILIQEERDLFLYRAGEPRPLYAKLSEGATFTPTMQALGLTPEMFPPLSIEAE